ncbi:hypothetical protein BJS_00159 [Bradyrhizobium japonicum SEMIA 5079]|nr:hypothetical protein BJS_00159 [Bradyrhizobium japonicum SEMIA 5079]
MSQPAHTFPFVTSRSNRRSQAEHRYMTRKSGKVLTTPVRFEGGGSNARRFGSCANLAFRGSPTMNRVPRRGRLRGKTG